MLEIQHYILFITSICLSGIGAWAVETYGRQISFISQPSERSSHRNATPNGGGIGILVAFMSSAVILQLTATFWIPAALLSAISFVGDRFEISFLIRLFVQFFASFFFLFGVIDKQAEVGHNFSIMLMEAFFIVGTANYYNFMDGINGIAGLTGIIAFGLLTVFLSHKDASINLIVMNISLGLGCLGFLPFNFPRARVFMGDVGSILLGFVFSAMVIWCSTSFSDFFCLTSFLFVFYADEITTALVRLKDREKLWHPHRRHLYQILANEYNFAHWKVSLGYGFAQLFIGLSILYFVELGLPAVLSLLFLYFVVFSVISLFLRKRLSQKSGMY